MKTDKEKHNDPEYWKECLSRVPEKDVFSRMMLVGKLKQLTKGQGDENR